MKNKCYAMQYRVGGISCNVQIIYGEDNESKWNSLRYCILISMQSRQQRWNVVCRTENRMQFEYVRM